MNIKPSAELRNKYNEISNYCRETKEPIYITVNGRGDTVVLNITEYDKMKAELELLRSIAEAENDVSNGRVSTIEDTFKDIRNNLNARK
ncbi:type II toxin-antitoxin system Phd/YefM family antitoxin [Haloplasma contractile]|uniref:Antitoxin n=1 Tax=Haloplasma contractile SSD-17B TaxID=1033810 RepID=U2FDI2_9MOLU|nr:type II toxin-antitoxin system Phd/YefM family antitoxin [Haloplasma contractile]ERJ11030.1 Antitoxin RelF protein [Haloplasma contractile SSD-17B]